MGVPTSKAELIDTLAQPDSSIRAVYDYFIDYATEQGCFVNRSGDACMFESYGTTIEFMRVIGALSEFTDADLRRIVESLRDTDFTPLARVLAEFVESWKKL